MDIVIRFTEYDTVRSSLGGGLPPSIVTVQPLPFWLEFNILAFKAGVVLFVYRLLIIEPTIMEKPQTVDCLPLGSFQLPYENMNEGNDESVCFVHAHLRSILENEVDELVQRLRKVSSKEIGNFPLCPFCC